MDFPTALCLDPRQLAGGPGEGPGRSGGLEGKQGASAARLGGWRADGEAGRTADGRWDGNGSDWDFMT